MKVLHLMVIYLDHWHQSFHRIFSPSMVGKEYHGKIENRQQICRHLTPSMRFKICLGENSEQEKKRATRNQRSRGGLLKFSKDSRHSSIYIPTTKSMVKGQWIPASQQATQAVGAGTTYASTQFRKKAKEFILSHKVPSTPWGTWNCSQIDADEELALEKISTSKQKGSMLKLNIFVNI
jgi:hypothetical protein